MKDITSKELLSEVLELNENVFVDSFTEDGNMLQILIKSYKSSSWYLVEINIHELAHKCKKWALLRGHCLVSCIKIDKSLCDIYDCNFIHSADTEPEAIFKACQWILDNKDK